jgi:hypothetical protein
VPNVAASAWTPGAGSDSGVYANANANLTYYVEVKGKGSSVAVDVSGLLYTTPTVYNSADEVVGGSQASIEIFNPSAALLFSEDADSVSGDYLTYNSTLYLVPDVIYEVELTAAANVNCAGVPTPVCPTDYQSAFADPTFTVLGGGSILESSNLIAVPEPGTWAMMLLGLCGLAAAKSLRREAWTGLTPVRALPRA